MTVLRAHDHDNGNNKAINKFSIHSHGTKIRTAVLHNRVVVDHKKECRQRHHRRSNALLLGSFGGDETNRVDDNSMSQLFEIPSDQFLTDIFSHGLRRHDSFHDTNCLMSQIMPSSMINSASLVSGKELELTLTETVCELGQSDVSLHSTSYAVIERDCRSPDFLFCHDPTNQASKSDSMLQNDSCVGMANVLACSDSEVSALCRRLCKEVEAMDHEAEIGAIDVIDSDFNFVWEEHGRNGVNLAVETTPADHLPSTDTARGVTPDCYSQPQLQHGLPDFHSKFQVAETFSNSSNDVIHLDHHDNNNLLLMMHHIHLHDVASANAQASQNIMIIPTTIQSVSCGL